MDDPAFELAARRVLESISTPPTPSTHLLWVSASEENLQWMRVRFEDRPRTDGPL